VASNSSPGQDSEKIERADNADLVLGILAEFDPEGIATVCDTLRTLPGSPRIAVVGNDHASQAPTSSEGPETSASVFFLPPSVAKPEIPGAPVLNMFAAYESIFAASEKVGARGCCIVASKLEAGTNQWVRQLAQPLLETDLDLLVPYYARHKFTGLLNSSIISPLTRSLYGKRIHNPMGPDLGVSQRLFHKMLETGRSAKNGGIHPLASLTSAALCQNLNVSEVHVGARIYPPTDWSNVSSLLLQVLGPIFVDMERNAACWQRIRGSISVPTIGNPVLLSPDNEKLDSSGMLESFQLGNRELQEIWGLVLPPATLFELRKLSRLPPESFHMPDELWVRIVYDFALAHRLRTITRDHLLKSLTPLYLGWVASYARELQVGTIAAEARLERLSFAYESGKPYLVSRWRWPDRFSP
jgi:glucosylglycerate synthase